MELKQRLFAPVDVASLALFRVCFGAILTYQALRFLFGDWVGLYWTPPSVQFTFYGFDWVRPWTPAFLYVHIVFVGIVSVLIAAGAWYRSSAALFFVAMTYLFLLEESRYLNHLYLVCLVGFLLIFVPAHRDYSIDARHHPEWPRTAPTWALWLLRAQIGIVYSYAGLAKLNPDWLAGEPVRTWVARRASDPVIGPLFVHEATVYTFVYGGLLLDLLVVPALLFRPTRKLAFVAAVVFHLTNAVVFKIGIFPWFMIVATTLFFAPDWPRRLAQRWLEARPPTSIRPRRLLERIARRPDERYDAASSPVVVSGESAARRSAVTFALVVYLAWQLLFPLRHLLYPGNVSWTEEGHRFAWHMLLRSKYGTAEFVVTDRNTGETWTVKPEDHLSARQLEKMPGTPDMILQFAHYLAAVQRGVGRDVEVRANVSVSLNGRIPQPLVDPSVDLAAQRRSLRPAAWILPLNEPLRRP